MCRKCSEEGHEEKDCPQNIPSSSKDKGKQIVNDGPSTSANLVEMLSCVIPSRNSEKGKDKMDTFVHKTSMIGVVT